MPTSPAKHPRPVSVILALAGAMACVIVASGGCSSAQHERGPEPIGSREAREDYTQQYALGRYQAAYDGASKAAESTTGVTQEQARLIAGLSAHALKREADTRRWLTPLLASKDREISGRASAGLGLLEQEKSNHGRAAELLGAAAAQLDEDDGARAGYHAGESLNALGRANSARLQYEGALAKAKDTRLRNQIQMRLDTVRPGGFTVQIGAFGSRANADKAMRSAAPTAARFNLGQPTITERLGPGGKPVYVVQVGRFVTRDQAAAAQRNFGGATVAPVSGGAPAAAQTPRLAPVAAGSRASATVGGPAVRPVTAQAPGTPSGAGASGVERAPARSPAVGGGQTLNDTIVVR